MKAVIVACALVVLASGTGSAASRPCMVDPTGDTSTPLADPSGDLTSVTVVSTRTQLTTTLRLAGLDAAPPVLGHRYDLYLDDGERVLSLTAQVDSGKGTYELVQRSGASESTASLGTSLGPVSGRLDLRTHTVVMTVPLSRLRWGTGRWVAVSARAWRAVGTMNSPLASHEAGRASTYWQSDDSDRAARHRVGTARCS